MVLLKKIYFMLLKFLLIFLMCMVTIIWLLVAALTVGKFGTVLNDSMVLRKIKAINSQELKKTKIIGNYNGQNISDKNLVYCSTFQLGWNKLKDNFFQENIKLEEQPAIVEYMNSSNLSYKDLSEDSYIAEAGFVRDDIEGKINSEIVRKFPRKEKIKLNIEEGNNIAIYVYMNKKIDFPKAFEEMKINFNTGKGIFKVKGFGISEESNNHELPSNINIIDYKNDDDFLIQLYNSTGDDIILAKTNKASNLKELVDSVLERFEKGKTDFFKGGDIFEIPAIKFNVNQSYDEIIGRKILNEKLYGYFIGEAKQNIEFLMWKKGIVLESNFFASPCTATSSQSELPKKLIFDKPFLLIMKERESKIPYYVMWVANDELMIK